MLVLTRKKGESVMLGNDIEVIVLGTEGDTVKLGFVAPKHVEIYRKEVFLSIQESNQEASSQLIDPMELNNLLKKQ